MFSGRTQATPVTAWLRVPLDWYRSATFSQFPDESHSSIKRTFYTPSQPPQQDEEASRPPTRRQFCGYCGTHLTAWNENLHGEHDLLDVTLGSLLSESWDTLETLNLLPDSDEEEQDDEDLVRQDDTATNEESRPGVKNPTESGNDTTTKSKLAVRPPPPHHMHGRGMPYFEEMVENSRLGRIKHQVGGHTSQDGRTKVHWEVMEIGGNGPDDPMEDVVEPGGGDNKRQKLAR